MIAGVADTHAALWHLFNDIRISIRAKDFIDQAALMRRKIGLSSISLAEVVYQPRRANSRIELANSLVGEVR